MKKKTLMSVAILLVMLVTCNIYFVLVKETVVAWFAEVEALAETECGVHDYDDEILVKRSEYCWDVHKSHHEWMDCSAYDKKCCDSTLQTTKPLCL